MQKREKKLVKKDENVMINHEEKMTKQNKRGVKMAIKKRTKNEEIAAAVRSLVVWSEMRVLSLKDGRHDDYDKDTSAVYDCKMALLELGIDVRMPSEKTEKEV